MATAEVKRQKIDSAEPAADSPRRKRRRSTSHLKVVPETKDLRTAIRAACDAAAAKIDKSRPQSKDELEEVARQLLAKLGHPESYLGWTMVALTSAFWRDQVAATPHSRRLFLLPHCLKHAEGCPADYDEFGLHCKECGACSIADFRSTAEDLGYKVLVAEGTPLVLKIIIGGYVDAIVGVACLNVLEKAIDKLILAGIPCMAVPLLSSDCRNTSVDEDWVQEMIELEHVAPKVQSKTYVHLMRAAADMFEPEKLSQLLPSLRKRDRSETGVLVPDRIEPLTGTEDLAFDFLTKGGKHSRPFITLAVHDALTGGRGTLADGAEQLSQLPDAVKRAAISIEVFHKASLVHDDIEDDDGFRYGDKTLHRRLGVPTAINVGDYLIGLGYRLVSQEAAALGSDVVADLLDNLAQAHLRLSEGQGAELLWRDAKNKELAPLDALKIYALKTAPAFEVALYMGIRLAGVADQYAEFAPQFARNLGVAFQIVNDLKDWSESEANKGASGGDVLGGRPTVLWAMALESLPESKRQELLELASTRQDQEVLLRRARALYTEAGVFEKAGRLVEKYQQKAEALADEVEPEDFRRLLYYLIDTVLDRVSAPSPPTVGISLPDAAPSNVAATPT